VALACRAQRGLFSQFGPITGAISVGLLMAVLFAFYASISNQLGMSQQQSRPLLVALGAIWHLLLGAQLGYCFTYFVPDHARLNR
jgi:apolipoprotein N-acyltransferase